MAGKSRKTKKLGGVKVVIFIIEIAVIGVLIWLLCKLFGFGFGGRNAADINGDSPDGGKPTYYVVNSDGITAEDLNISEEVQKMSKEGGVMSGYTNIALFGIDATSTGISALEKGSRSDTIIIVSINQASGDVKLCSIYRDTYLNTGVGGYQKCNAAYALGGGNVAVSMLNANLDLNISNWVAVSYRGLVDAINCLGGIYIDVDSSEIDHLNNYQIGISEVLGCDYTPVTQTGYQLLDGIQASAYCRIRYTAGDDFKRAERQREVLQATMEQAKKADTDTLIRTFNTVSSNVLTSIDSDTFLDMVKNVGKYNIVGESGFPETSLRTTGTIGAKGSCVIPVNLESNVIWLHQYLFGDDSYTTSETVREYSSKINNDTKGYIN